MVAALNPNYQPPSRDILSNTLVPAWYKKLYTDQSIARWAARNRTVVVWLKRAVLAKPVLKEKQRLLNVPEHRLDVKTRWNTLFLLVER
ncbi:unnamed protein product [Boreogadus saida]